MHKSEFDKSMERILAFYGRPKDKDAAEDMGRYLSALYETVKWMDGFHFDGVTKQLAQEISPLKKPMPAQFLALQRKLYPKSVTVCGPVQMSKADSDAYCLKTAQEMGSEGAKVTLERINRLNLAMPEGVIEALLASSCKPPRKKAPHSLAKEVFEVIEKRSRTPQPTSIQAGTDALLNAIRGQMTDKSPGVVVEEAPPVERIKPMTDAELEDLGEL